MRRCDDAGPHGAWLSGTALKGATYSYTQHTGHCDTDAPTARECKRRADSVQSFVSCLSLFVSAAPLYDKYSRVIFDIAILSPLAELLPSQSWPSSSPPSRHFHHVQLHTYWAH